MKKGLIGKDLDLESKLSLREKQKRKKELEEEAEKVFYEKTGIKNTGKDLSFENLIKKYEYDMNKYEKKLAKMKILDK